MSFFSLSFLLYKNDKNSSTCLNNIHSYQTIVKGFLKQAQQKSETKFPNVAPFFVPRNKLPYTRSKPLLHLISYFVKMKMYEKQENGMVIEMSAHILAEEK